MCFLRSEDDDFFVINFLEFIFFREYMYKFFIYRGIKCFTVLIVIIIQIRCDQRVVLLKCQIIYGDFVDIQFVFIFVLIFVKRINLYNCFCDIYVYFSLLIYLNILGLILRFNSFIQFNRCYCLMNVVLLMLLFK